MSEQPNDKEEQPNGLSMELRYLSDLTGFRRIIQQKQQDETYAPLSSPKQILYAVDANILELCFDPHNNRSLTRPFRFINAQDDRDAGIAIITAESRWSFGDHDSSEFRIVSQNRFGV